MTVHLADQYFHILTGWVFSLCAHQACINEDISELSHGLAYVIQMT